MQDTSSYRILYKVCGKFISHNEATHVYSYLMMLIHFLHNCFCTKHSLHEYINSKVATTIQCMKLRHTVVCQQPRKTCSTQECYLQEPLSHSIQHLISLIIGPILIKFTYFMPSIYMTLHTKFEKNRLSSLQDIRF